MEPYDTTSNRAVPVKIRQELLQFELSNYAQKLRPYTFYCTLNDSGPEAADIFLVEPNTDSF